MGASDVDNIIQECNTSLTVFLGGAGMRGGYNEEFIQVLKEAGICNPVSGNFSGPLFGFTDDGVYGNMDADMIGDAISVPHYNDSRKMTGYGFYENYTASVIERRSMQDNTLLKVWPDDDYQLAKLGISDPVPLKQDRFNIIGYSWGAVIACLVAHYYAAQGYEIDTLVLLGAPVEQSLLDIIYLYPVQIKQVIIKNLKEYGDPIYAGMSDFELMGAVPELNRTMNSDPKSPQKGHFYYSGSGTSDTIKRKRMLVSELMQKGLK